jgi:hypothetical protein
LKVLVDRFAEGYQVEDGVGGLADTEDPIRVEGYWMKAP